MTSRYPTAENRDCIDGDDGVEIAVDAFGCSCDAARAAWAAQVAEEGEA